MFPLEGPTLSPVMVCGAESWLVQVIVVPFLTVIELGLKAKLEIITDAVDGTGAGTDFEIGGVTIGAGTTGDGLVWLFVDDVTELLLKTK